jgi:hypothetical protein
VFSGFIGNNDVLQRIRVTGLPSLEVLKDFNVWEIYPFKSVRIQNREYRCPPHIIPLAVRSLFEPEKSVIDLMMMRLPS